MKCVKQTNKVVLLLFSIGLMLLVVGVTYAFFIYNKSGNYVHGIEGGKMQVIYEELSGNNIVIENAYPLTDEEALDEGLEFDFTITGYNESKKNIYYAIEMDYGDERENKTRFLDSDLKLTLYENDKIMFENQIFDNLDNQDIHYGYIEYGTSQSRPTINNYRLRIWINDNVVISDTQDSVEIAEDETVYTSEEFGSKYANFRVNVKANLTYKDVDYITYNANGGEGTPEKTSLLTNMITLQKPVMEGKAFLGWSTDPNAKIPEYKSGDSYVGDAKMLYAIYGQTRNVMGDLSAFNDYKEIISQVIFINDSQENIDIKYNNAKIKADLTYEDYGTVKAWLEPELRDLNYQILYIGSEGTTYLSTGKELFKDWAYVSKFDFSNADTSMVTDMSYMFCGLDHNAYYATHEIVSIGFLKELDLTAFNTSNVTNMSSMFASISWTPTINILSFDTSNVTTMNSMFLECRELNNLDISNFDTSNVKDMGAMFYNCSKLEKMDLSNFNTSKVANMERMFHFCYELTELNIQHFDTFSVTNMSSMFYNCGKLEKLDLSNFNTSKVENMSSMFSSCYELPELNIQHFNTSNVTNMSNMFYNCPKLEKLDLSSFDTSKVIDMSSMFYNCDGLTILDLSNFDTSSVTTMSSMFGSCSNLNGIDLSAFDTRNVTRMGGMFSYCTSIVELDLSSFDTAKVTSMGGMFSGCTNLKNLLINTFDTSNVTDMSRMFYSCEKITEIDLSSFDTGNVTTMRYMFENCFALLSLDLSHFDTSKVTDMSSMFAYCKSLVDLNLSNFDTSSVTSMGGVSSSVIWGMFYCCYKLKELDLSSFDTSKVKDMSYMFSGCWELTTIYVSNKWSTKSVTNSANMFRNSKKLVGAIVYDSNKLSASYANYTTGYFTLKTT